MAFAKDADDRVRLEAIKILLDRGYGRPPQPLTAEDDGGPRRIVVSWMSPTDDPPHD